MADAQHVEIALKGARAILEWRKQNPAARLDLSGADLRKADWASDVMPAVIVDDADMRGVSLEGICCGALRAARTDLRGADLYATHLLFANLDSADLSDAVMQQAHIEACSMLETKLCRADLCTTQFSDMNIFAPDFTGAQMGHTIFADVDLSRAQGLDRIVHRGPSTLGVDTLLRSKGTLPDVFLDGCGLPTQFRSHVVRQGGAPASFYSCFISYTESDRTFVDRLYKDMQASGIRCWRWPEDGTWGHGLMRAIDSAIRQYDKLVLICSRASLASEPVIREVERALQKEQRESLEVLFPVRIDDYVLEWNHSLQADILKRCIGDFRRWNDEREYKIAFARLVDALEREFPATPQPGDGPAS
jgi:uncharacterized protein YjbI with pentapeptide repeats